MGLPPEGVREWNYSTNLHVRGGMDDRSLLAPAPTQFLARLGYNDTASAVEVHDGLWDLCTDSVFKGRCITLGPGRHVLSGGTHDRASSVRPRVADNTPAWRGGDPDRRAYQYQ